MDEKTPFTPIFTEHNVTASFPSFAMIPKAETETTSFLQQFPSCDGRGIVVAVLDCGIDPGAPGLQVTSDGKPKLLDLIDTSGSTDVEMSVVKTLDEKTKEIEGLTGRMLSLGDWDNPTRTYRLGIKRGYELFPKELVTRLKKERKKKFENSQRELINKIQRQISECDKAQNKQTVDKKDLEVQLDQLQDMAKNYEDPGPIYDCLVFQDSKGIWRAVIDTSESGDLTKSVPMADYRIERQWSRFGEDNMFNYSVNIYEDGRILSIVCVSGSHGTHVAGILGANNPQEPFTNGLAPGVQIISIKIGDTRLGTMETGTALIRALIACKQLKPDLINMSYGEPVLLSNVGRFTELANELVTKYGIIFVSSAGNNGPALSTTGAPGGTTTNIIGVGAAVFPNMYDIDYSLSEKLPENHFTWSSRGPNEDGALGVSISAPGGAIAPIPNYTLSRSQLMSGTSMASPNACGAIAVLLSALKQHRIPYNPASIRRAIELTAQKMENVEVWAQGNGLLQIRKAYDYLVANKDITPFHLEGKFTDRNNARGLYIRERYEFESITEWTLEVNPIFENETDKQYQIDFELRLNLKSTLSGVIVPEHCVLPSAGRTLKIRFDPTSFEMGTLYYGEIQGFDSQHPERGPLLRIPLTVIKPLELQVSTYESGWLKFKPGQIERRFLVVPRGATWVVVTIQAKGIEPTRNFVLHGLQLHPQKNIKHTLVEKYFTLTHESSLSHSFEVVGERTLELTVAQMWSSCGDTGEVSFQAEFHGLSALNNDMIYIPSGEKFVRIELSAPLRMEEIRPCSKLAVIQRVLKPTSHIIKPASFTRDVLFDGQQIYEMQLTYQYEHNIDTSYKIIVRVPAMSDMLYESIYETQFWMVFDQNKRLIRSGDAWPEAFALPAKGNYLVKVQFRHENQTTLTRLSKWPLFIERQIPKNNQLSLDFYTTPQDALSNTNKLSRTISLLRGKTIVLWLHVPEENNLPQNAVTFGDNLIGTATFRKFEGEEAVYDSKKVLRPLGGCCVCYSVPPLPSTKTAPPSQPQANQVVAVSGKSLADRIEETLQNASVKFLLDLIHQKQFEEFKQALSIVKISNALKLLLLNLRFAVATRNDKVEESFTKIIEAADAIINAINLDTLSSWKQQKQTDKTMDEQEESLIEALHAKGLAMSKTLQLKTVPTEEETERFLTHVQLMKKWISTMDTDSKYLHINVAHELVKKEFGSALSLLRKHIATSPSKESYEEMIKVLELLKWNHWSEYERKWQLIRFPNDFPLMS